MKLKQTLPTSFQESLTFRKFRFAQNNFEYNSSDLFPVIFCNQTFWTLNKIMAQVILPHLGEGIEKATVAFWHCKLGDKVDKDSELVELVTDKASFNVTSDFSGVVKEILVPQGQEAKIGQALAVIE